MKLKKKIDLQNKLVEIINKLRYPDQNSQKTWRKAALTINQLSKFLRLSQNQIRYLLYKKQAQGPESNMLLSAEKRQETLRVLRSHTKAKNLQNTATLSLK